MRWRLAIHCPIAFVLFVLLAAPSNAAPSESRWTLGIGGGGTFPYSYHQRPSPYSSSREDKFRRAFLAHATANRKIGQRISIQTAVDLYSRADDETQISARIVSFASGVRRRIGREQYVECLPALYVGRWTDTVTRNSITSLRPGVELGVGVQGPIAGSFSLDLGLRFRYSTGWPNARQRWYDTEDYRGLRQVILGGTVLVGL